MRRRPTRRESTANSETAVCLLLSPLLVVLSSPSESPANPASLLMLATCKKAKMSPRLSKTVEAGPKAASSTVEAQRPITAVSTAESKGEAKLEPRAGRANLRIAATSATHG